MEDINHNYGKKCLFIYRLPNIIREFEEIKMVIRGKEI